MAQSLEPSFPVALRKSIRGIILVVFLQIVAAVVWSLAHPYGVYWYYNFGLWVIVVIGLVTIGALLSIRVPLVVVVDHYANDFLGTRGQPDRASDVRGISSGVVSLIILGVVFASFFNPADVAFGAVGFPTFALDALFIVIAVALLFTIYQKSKFFIGDITEKLASGVAPETAQPGTGTVQVPAQTPVVPQAGMKFCLNCGQKIPVNSKFCKSCGTTQQ